MEHGHAVVGVSVWQKFVAELARFGHKHACKLGHPGCMFANFDDDKRIKLDFACQVVPWFDVGLDVGVEHVEQNSEPGFGLVFNV